MSKLTISLPPEVEQYEHDIRRFVDAMVYKLKVHSAKGRWEDLSLQDSLPLLLGEVEELREAIEGGNMVEILLEAADTANFALIIASTSVERGK